MDDLELIDAHAGRIEPADAIFVFGTRHWSAAELAASLYLDGFEQTIVTTGGASRHPRGRSEGQQHRDLLVAAGVPERAILAETTSTSTAENVVHALPLMAGLGTVRSVVAVVKWFHRRAVITLAQHVPTLERIYAADYEPFDHTSRAALSRATWERSCPKRVAREIGYLHELGRSPIDTLQRTDCGWIRTQ